MPKLSREVQVFIITRLACYDRPSVVRDEVRETFGIEVKLPHILYYDATAASTRLSEEYRTLFFDVRKRFREEIEEIPIASKAWRLRQRQRLFEKNDTNGNTVAAREDLDQAAREMGDAFSNRRELTGAGGGPIAVKDSSLEELSTEQLAAIAAQLAGQVSSP